MTCSILSAIIASTKVMNWARKPGWRIAANDRRVAGGASAGIALISLMPESSHAARVEGHIRQREAWDMFERIRASGFIVRAAILSMADQAGDICACRVAPPCRTLGRRSTYAG